MVHLGVKAVIGPLRLKILGIMVRLILQNCSHSTVLENIMHLMSGNQVWTILLALTVLLIPIRVDHQVIVCVVS